MGEERRYLKSELLFQIDRLVADPDAEHGKRVANTYKIFTNGEISGFDLPGDVGLSINNNFNICSHNRETFLS